MDVMQLLFSFPVIFAITILVCVFSIPPRNLPSSLENGDEKKRLLLLVAHPDDESMFFGPSLLSLGLLDPYEIRLVCISTGNADGMGDRRNLEMLSACSTLKVLPKNVEVMDHPSLQDGFGEHWNQNLLVEIIRQAVLDHKINIVLTFDNYGVSGHPNHISLSAALRAYLSEQQKLHSKESSMVEGWELVSLNMFRKYSGVIDIISSSVQCLLADPRRLHCFITPSPWTSIAAMRHHKSQWLWFRRLFVIFASYTYVNMLIKINSECESPINP